MEKELENNCLHNYQDGICKTCGDTSYKEKRVYVINADEDFDFREEEKYGEYENIMEKAEELGTVYSLEGFQESINNEELDLSNSFIFIN